MYTYDKERDARAAAREFIRDGIAKKVYLLRSNGNTDVFTLCADKSIAETVIKGWHTCGLAINLSDTPCVVF